MHRVFVAPEHELTEYANVIVDGRTGVLVGPRGRFVLEQADEVLYWHPETLARSTRRGSSLEHEELQRTQYFTLYASKLMDFRPRMRKLDPEINYIYMLHPFGWYAFGHLFDSFQRLRHAIGVVPEPWKILHSRADRIVGFEQHLSKLGVEPEQLIELNNETVIVPKLWISPWQSPPAQLTDESFDWIFDSYTKDVPSGRPQRLYLSRNHVRDGERNVLNEEKVTGFLRERGFHVLYGTEDFDEILFRFYHAELIVAPHGSLLANTMFCGTEGCRILEFCPDNRVDRSFKGKLKKATRLHTASVCRRHQVQH